MQTEKVLAAFREKGYRATYFETKEEAVAYLTSALKGCRIGFGGSATLDEMHLYEALSEKNDVFWHWKQRDGKTPAELRKIAADCPVYFSSANAVTEDGKIVNVDGTANRVAALLYGKEKVFYVCGKNKICKTEQDAVFRARNVAAPINTARLGLDTPCAKTGRCHDCKSPQRICRALSVLWEKPSGQDAQLILIGEDLGF